MQSLQVGGKPVRRCLGVWKSVEEAPVPDTTDEGMGPLRDLGPVKLPLLSALLEEVAEQRPPTGMFPELPTGDRAPFQQMTFTLSDMQAQDVKAAMDAAKDAGPFDETGNENSNGNALARICEEYLSWAERKT